MLAGEDEGKGRLNLKWADSSVSLMTDTDYREIDFYFLFNTQKRNESKQTYCTR